MYRFAILKAELQNFKRALFELQPLSSIDRLSKGADKLFYPPAEAALGIVAFLLQSY